MFTKYDIVNYNKNTGEITFRFENNENQKITIDINREYPSYEPCYDYYFDEFNKIHQFKDSNGEEYLYKNKKGYTKCYQYQYDKLCKKFPISDNGRLYIHFESIYNNLFT